jgi:hypothetical protein
MAKVLLISGLISLLAVGYLMADDSEFRLVVSQNDTTAGTGEFRVDVEVMVPTPNTVPRTLNSLTVDVDYGSNLTAPTDTAAINWFPAGSTNGYFCSVSKLTDSYRVLVTADTNGTIGGGATGYELTANDTWYKLVTLRWKISTVQGSYDVSIVDDTDAAAYYVNHENNPEGSVTDFASSRKPPATLKVASKIFMEGPYDSGTGEMTTALRTAELIPNQSPYNRDSRTVGSVPGDLPADITDWVMLQLRSKSDGVPVTSKSVFLKKDGTLINDDGTLAEIEIPSIEGEKDYYLVLKHRNHLAVMSNSVQALNGTSSSQYDFTTGSGQFYGTDGALDLGSGVWGMISGDGDQNAGIYLGDYILYKNTQGNESYEEKADFNLDSGVYLEDYIIYKTNQGKESKVP